MMKILVVEDDEKICRYIQKGFEELSHHVDLVMDGTEALCLLVKKSYDVIILDRMLPGIDGLTILETLRKKGDQTPVIFLSALADVKDRVDGLKSGGDDYLVKPFAFSELQARVEVIVSRKTSHVSTDMVLTCHDLKLDLVDRIATRDGKKIPLQNKEFKLLEYLLKHKGKLVTRTMLLEHVWNYSFDPQTNMIDVHVSRIRKKIDGGYNKKLIHTLRGEGYTIKEPSRVTS